MEIKIIDNSLRSVVNDFIKNSWGSEIMVVKGRAHNMESMPGFVAIEENKIIGFITYNIENKECEIVSLDSFSESKGIGTLLLNNVVELAKKEKCTRIWIITTNDNIRALGFYQKREFNIKNIYINAVNEARKIKPEIPMKSENGISILHEIELERVLSIDDDFSFEKNDLTVSEMMKLSYSLWKKNKEKWAPMEPQYGRSFILYMIEEIGEVIAILKKKGETEIMNNITVREHFVEELGDVLMYYMDVLNRFQITPSEFSNVYIKKYKTNMNRNYEEQYKSMQ